MQAPMAGSTGGGGGGIGGRGSRGSTSIPGHQATGIQIMPLGAGQDVGRSCVMVHADGRSIMFDCGMHVGYHDERRQVLPLSSSPF